MKRSFLILLVIFSACAGGVIGSLITLNYLGDSLAPYKSIQERQQPLLTNYSQDTSHNLPTSVNFQTAAQAVTPAVVHIRTSYGMGSFSVNPLEFNTDGAARSSGSGVILTDDGYIATNNHVIEDATNIEVVMNDNQRFYAKLIGTDPTTDLALLKVKGNNLPFVPYGDYDKVYSGEWVLAIGNPFDLNSTVTAGIVSAKARNIGILRDRNNLQVESFIQTDAAVNPGNSGGALVNLRGELVGINTAIATSSGSYQGYSFAIPVSLVKKVMDDLLEYGKVQRGLLGVQILDVDSRMAEELNLTVTRGVLIRQINKGSAAEDSKLQIGDVVVSIDDHPVASVPEMQELVARHRPGTDVKVTYMREGKRSDIQVRLKSVDGTYEAARKEVSYKLEGAVLEDIPYKELTDMQLEGGARVTHLDTGKWKEAGVKPGFIIAFIDKIPVENVADLNRILEFKNGGILVEGFYTDGTKATYGVEW